MLRLMLMLRLIEFCSAIHKWKILEIPRRHVISLRLIIILRNLSFYHYFLVTDIHFSNRTHSLSPVILSFLFMAWTKFKIVLCWRKRFIARTVMIALLWFFFYFMSSHASVDQVFYWSFIDRFVYFFRK